MQRLMRIFAKIVYRTLGNILPQAHKGCLGKVGKRIRAFCGRHMLASCGRNVNIYPKAVFAYSVELGDNSDIGYESRIAGKCIIGKDVIMGPQVWIYTRNHNTERVDIPIKYQGSSEEKPVVIGDGCWICARAFILPGVHIGEGAVVAAGAVVVKDVPPYSVVGGVPARVLKYRRSPETIDI